MDITIIAWTPERGQKIPGSLKRSLKGVMKRAKIFGSVSIIPGCMLVEAKGVSSDDAVYLMRMLQNAGYQTGIQV